MKVIVIKQSLRIEYVLLLVLYMTFIALITKLILQPFLLLVPLGICIDLVLEYSVSDATTSS